MRLVLIADTHGMHNRITVPDGDVLIHAGDLTMSGSRREYEPVAKWLNNQPHEHIIIVAGNHDFGSFQIIPLLSSKVDYLENTGTEIGDIKFWGSPMTPQFGLWAHMAKRGPEMKRYWDMIPKDTHVLITHGPPQGILDCTNTGDTAGCEDLLHAVVDLSPEVHVFGHIHEAYGQLDTRDLDRPVNGPVFVNASVVDFWYRPVNAPVVVDI